MEPEEAEKLAPALPSPAPPPRPPRHGWLRRSLRWLSWGLLAALLSLALWELVTWPDVAALAKNNPKTTAFIETYRHEAASKDGKPAKPDWRWVPYGQISGALKRAVLVAEDIDFFSHQGFAVEEMKIAVRDALEEGKSLRGASTLTQQLAKNLWLSPSRNPWRKVKEAVLTWQLERELEKRRILELYLNVVEFGPGIYGAEAAARRYFGKSCYELSEHEAAALAAALPSPTKWFPGSKSKARERRTAMIEGRMKKAEWLAKEI